MADRVEVPPEALKWDTLIDTSGPLSRPENRGLQYRPNYTGMGEVLRGDQMKALLRLMAIKAVEMAKATAPRKSSRFANSIHAEQPTTVEFLNQFGRIDRRASVRVVADSDDALTVEFGGKRRYHLGENREGHHTLNNVVKVLNGQYKVEERRQLELFRARNVSAAPGSPKGGPGTPGGGVDFPGGKPARDEAPTGL